MDKIKAFFSRIGMDENTIIHLNPVFLGRVQTACVMHIPPRLPIKMEEKLVRTRTAKSSPSRAAPVFVRKKRKRS